MILAGTSGSQCGFKGGSKSRLCLLSDLRTFDQNKTGNFRFLFGTDEAGRGPLAGPVVAAAVCLKDTAFCHKIGDSKSLSERQRSLVFHEIHERAWVGTGVMSETVIDAVNILNASHLAMTAAVRDMVCRMPPELTGAPDFFSAGLLLVDGNSYSGTLPFSVQTVVAGDARSLSIACASVVAKVLRDRLMAGYDQVYPGYGFARHKGYPTADHREAVRHKGLSPIHRRTFSMGEAVRVAGRP